MDGVANGEQDIVSVFGADAEVTDGATGQKVIGLHQHTTVDVWDVERDAFAGQLRDAETAAVIGAATYAQLLASLRGDDDTGFFLVDGDGDPIDESKAGESWVPQPVRKVYVA